MIAFGFLGSQNFVPSLFSGLCGEKISQIFLTLYNANVSADLRISAKFAKNASETSQIFKNFLKSEIVEKKPAIFTKNHKKCAKFCVKSNEIILNFLKNKNLPQIAILPKLKVAKILNMLNQNGHFGLVFDAQTFFGNFVFDKISCKNQKCEICLKNEMIIISKNGDKMGIIPHFRSLDFKSQNFSADIKNATLHESFSELKTLYLIYPKSANFRRHIEIKSEKFRENFTLKLVPYCINNKIY